MSTAESSLDPAVLSGDFKRAVQLKQSRALSNSEKYYLLTNHFVPPHNYKFPSHDYGKQKRHFQFSWLSKFNGLVYSELDDGGYCKYCVLFGQPSPSVPALVGTFITRPLTHLGKASEKLREHFQGVKGCSARKYHLEAVQMAEAFISVMSKKQLPVDQQLSRARAVTIEKNRQLLKSIADTVIFCGRQGIALRGHRDSMKKLDLDEVTKTNPGNFLALLKFRAESGDTVLASHLQSGSKNALYTSKTIQNELIEICGDIIRSTLLSQIQASRVFSIMADEATDASNKEQLAICARYVEQDTQVIEERFLGFTECDTGVTGEAIASRILQHLDTWQLPALQLRGQTYDGAGAMAGKKKGAATRILELYPKALYTHCAAHVLNLCIVKSCSIPDIRNTMDAADSISRFFAYSPKRQLCLEKAIHDMSEGEHRKRLKSVCKTRWVERHEAFETFLDFFQPLVHCLEEIRDSTGWNQESRKDAQSHLLCLTRFSFIFSLVVTKEVLGFSKALSIKLQGRYVDIVKAYHDVGLVRDTLTSTRAIVDQFHSRIYKVALDIADKVSVEESRPRTASRQQHRGNVPSTTTSEYYMRLLTIPALDYLISEITDRFSPRLTNILQQILNLLPVHISESKNILSSADIPDLVKLYADDMVQKASLDTELHCWTVKWQQEKEHAKSLNTPYKVLHSVDRDFFPNIKQLMTIACTLSVTSSECERSISRLRYLKTYLRSTMTEQRLNGLAMLYVHRDIHCSSETVVDIFARSHPRRMLLVDPLVSE